MDMARREWRHPGLAHDSRGRWVDDDNLGGLCHHALLCRAPLSPSGSTSCQRSKGDVGSEQEDSLPEGGAGRGGLVARGAQAWTRASAAAR
jgi:hypothetical protein